MFTGIVEKHVPVLEIVQKPMAWRIWIANTWPDLGHGESVAVNGCCLTIAEIQPDRLGFDVIKETLEKTNLGRLKANDRVNVERALRVGDRLDGHFVQGHVDGTGQLVNILKTKDEVRLTVKPPAELRKYLVHKGSVAIDGVSLTIASVNKDDTFDVALIPTTLDLTTLGNRVMGWPFNLEADIVSKHIVAWLEARESTK
jgi:riboflavin synthase